MSPIYQPGKLVLQKQFTPQSYMWDFPALYPIFTPANITTALWLDAADSTRVFSDAGTTVASNGAAVQQWNDKSGNNLHLTQATLANRPAFTSNTLAGKPVLTFDGSNDLLEVTTGLTGLSNVTIISLFRIVSATADDIPMAINSQGVSGALRGFYRGVGGSVIFAAGWARDFTSTLSWDVGGGFHIFGFMNTSLNTPDNMQAHRDGVVQTGSSSGGNLINTTTGGFSVGNVRGGGYPANMEVAEIVILASAASTDTRQRIEGYLAHKWGLTANLPSDHPYKTVGPTT